MAHHDHSREVPENYNALYKRSFQAARGAARAAGPMETSGHRRIRAGSPDMKVEYDEATGMPCMVTGGRSADRAAARLASAAGSEEESAMTFVHEQGDLWELSADDMESVEVLSVSRQGLKAVRLVQRVEGKEVFNSETTVGLSSDNEVMMVSGQLFNGSGAPRSRSNARSAPQTSEPAAISLAIGDLTGLTYPADEFVRSSSPGEGDYRLFDHQMPDGDDRPRLERPVRVKDVMFPLGQGTFLPGYYMELWIRGFPAFSYVIDCMDQPDEILFRKNLSSHFFSYRVHNTGDAVLRPHDGPAPGTPHPTGAPDGFQAATISEVDIVTDGLLGDPWLPAGATRTEGNNCIAYADLTRSNRPGPGNPFGTVTAPGEFHHTYDHSKSASDPTNLQASLVGMFFHVNWLHDRWYQAGFDEASGNAQQDNFGRGGLGGDPILAEGNDGSGTDNANMATPADGASPRMQMFEFVGVPAGTPSRTSNFEALITFHEMGHYITNRLVGNASGLGNRQGRAMGEGWGDFFAVCMTSQASDGFADGAFPSGGWTDLTTSQNDNYYYGIRRYPYSADMGKNPLTFKHIGSGVILPSGPPRNAQSSGPNNSVHKAGEVWCTMLWEVFVSLVSNHGHEEGEERMLRYVIGGLKLTRSNPTFTQARDGIISAVTTLEPGDLDDVWQAFAKRGIGDGAVSPSSSSRSLTGVVESFSVP